MKRLSTPILIIAVLALCLRLNEIAVAADPPAKPSVRMVVDYSDGVEKHFKEIPWRDGLTVLDVLKHAAKHPRGIKYEGTGSGATFFLGSLDGVKNQDGSDRNWIFSVNGKKGNKSCAVTELKPSDVVEWKFDTFDF